METKEEHYLVPAQQQGSQKDFSHSEMAEDTGDAEDWFVEAKERLLDVNNWKKYSTLVSARFSLADSHGRDVTRTAHKGDHIKIDIPGPGTEAGNGYDWVHIEAIEYDDYPDQDMETLAVRVRPAANPEGAEDATAHFFSHVATSTFVIERQGRKLYAAYHGRNESPNTEGGAIDTIRNSVVAAGAWMGLSDAQWKGLIAGFLDNG